jgi:hypothetical protein
VNTAKLVKSYVQAALGLFCGFKFLLQAQRTGSDPEQAPAQQIPHRPSLHRIDVRAANVLDSQELRSDWDDQRALPLDVRKSSAFPVRRS